MISATFFDKLLQFVLGQIVSPASYSAQIAVTDSPQQRIRKSICPLIKYDNLCREKKFRHMNKSMVYITPKVEMLDMISEGVLCGSNELDLNPEEGSL